MSVTTPRGSPLAERTAAGYKLPEPTLLADAYADEVKADVSE